MNISKEEFMRIASGTYDELSKKLDFDKQNFYDFESGMVEILRSQNNKILQASVGKLPKKERDKKKS
jgi:hypothetical protein